MKVRAVIADDERLARRRVRRLLEPHPWLECIGEAATGRETVDRVRQLTPDVLFLDVQMPGLLGTEAAAQLYPRPFVIFTTAHRDHAVEAFDLRALDFLLKPIEPERFAEALDRLRDALEKAPTGPRTGEEAEGPPARLFVRRLGTLVPIAVDDILHLEADGEYVTVHTAAGSHSVHTPLHRLAEQLDPERFLRVHRSHVVNLDQVEAFRPHDGVRLRAELRDGSAVIVSRRASRLLRQRGR